MKTEKFTLRLTTKERERLEKMALKENKNASDYLRFLIFNKKNSNTATVIEQLSLIVENQTQQLQQLEEFQLRSKKHLRHSVILSASIFQIRYTITKLVNILDHIHRDAFPRDFDFPNNKSKDEFIKAELEKVAKELEEINL